MWKIMQSYFVTVGCHETESIAMYAIDSLKQLAVKFLKQTEFSSFDYQKQFLKPFELIYLQIPKKNEVLRDIILGCVTFMLQHSISEIRSGWR